MVTKGMKEREGGREEREGSKEERNRGGKRGGEKEGGGERRMREWK